MDAKPANLSGAKKFRGQKVEPSQGPFASTHRGELPDRTAEGGVKDVDSGQAMGAAAYVAIHEPNVHCHPFHATRYSIRPFA